MKKCILCILALVLLTLAVCPVSLADQETFVGDWVCVAVDPGDGNRQTTYEGTEVAELMNLPKERRCIRPVPHAFIYIGIYGRAHAGADARPDAHA